MALREKFGRLVLLEQTDSDPLGDEYRAARLGPSGFDRLVSVTRFSPAVSGHAEASKRLVDEARLVSQLQNPGLVRVLGVGRVGQFFYVSTELIEGRSVRAVLRLCSEEGFPFAVDHALMIASRVAAALEYLHGRKGEDGQAIVHGLLTPGRLVVAFDGEVKVKGLGLWPALGATGLLAPEERLYLAPEQAEGAAGPRSDVYALGLVLLEALCSQGPDGRDPLERIAAARIASPGGEPAPLPKPLSNLLRKALGREPAARFASMAEMRKAIDALLFSGDFTPTTFDLAFFMHTLFRDEVERDQRAIEEARTGDYQEFVVEDAAKAGAPRSPQTEPFAAHAPGPEATDALGALPTAVPLAGASEAQRPHDSPAPQASRPAGPDSSSSRLARAARESAARAPHAAAPAGAGKGRGVVLALGVVAALAVGGAAGWLYLAAQRREATQAAAAAEQKAAQARVHDLEARIAQLEREKSEAEAKAAEEARAALEKQSAAGGQKADPAAIARAQDEARKRARAEQERKQQEELAKLAEAKHAEEQRAAAAQAALATPPPTPLPASTAQGMPTPTPAIELSPGGQASAPGPAGDSTLPRPLAATPTPGAAASPAGAPAGGAAGSASQGVADPTDPAVRPPGLISEDPIPYPARAIFRRITTVVVVRALVDETGKVIETSVVQPSGQPPEYGFDQAAVNRVKGRKYRPARRNDVPVRIWVNVRVEFRPPPAR